jgi:dihydrofolate reductase
MITLIAAVASNGVIGNSSINSLPWYCSDELKFFKAETMGNTLIMGRTTAEQVGKLPGRDAIVLSRDKNYTLKGFETFSMDQFLFEYEQNPEKRYMVCGGAEIYKLFMPYADMTIISTLNFPAEGDVYLPCMNRRNGYKFHIVEEKEYNEFTVVKWKPWEYAK